MSRLIFHMKGFTYSTNKKEWKKVLAAYEMKWVGNMEAWIWIGDKEKLVADFHRDMTVGERGVTKDAYLMWESEHTNTDFKEAFIDFWGEIDGVKTVDKMPDEDEEEDKQETLDKYIKSEQFRVDKLKEPSPHTGKPAPGGFIKSAEREMEENVAKKRVELGLDEPEKKEEANDTEEK